MSLYPPERLEKNLATLTARYTGSIAIMGYSDNAGELLHQVVVLRTQPGEAKRRQMITSGEGNAKIVSTIEYDEAGSEIRRYPTMARARIPSIRYDLVSTSDNLQKVADGLRKTGVGVDRSPVYPGFGGVPDTMMPEDNAPHFTPRVTGVIEFGHSRLDNAIRNIRFSARHKYVDAFVKEQVPLSQRPTGRRLQDVTGRGVGLGVPTYNGPGEPRPSYAGQPLAVPLKATLQGTAEFYRDQVDPDTFEAVAVRSITAGKSVDHHIINALDD